MKRWLAAIPLCLGAFSAAAQTQPDSLAQAWQGIFKVGAAISPGQVMYGGTLIEQQFNIIVAENAMKAGSLARAGEGQYDFTTADAMVDWALAHKVAVRGHTLVWHNQSVDWMFDDGHGGTATREVVVARLRKYIHDVVGHFRGRVFAWDVVNEAFVPDEPGTEQVKGWRNSAFYRVIGPEFIALAFQFAHEADPQALLFYNDYSTEHPAKHQMILALIRDLQAKGIPIHGIGHQSHYTIAQPADFKVLEQHIVDIGKLGLTNHITELDISLHRDIKVSSADDATPELLALQAQRYSDLFAMCARQRDKVSAVLTWGVSDAGSWLRQWPQARFDAPLLFDDDMEPKPAFDALIKLGKASPR